MQTQPLQFRKKTSKVSSRSLLKVIPRSTYFLPAKNKIPILWIELQTRKNQNFTSKHQAVKNLQIAKTFPKNVNKEPT